MMPHTCPNCHGVGQRKDYDDVGYFATNLPMLESCRSCQGTGVVWEPDSGPYEITFTPNDTVWLGMGNMLY